MLKQLKTKMWDLELPTLDKLQPMISVKIDFMAEENIMDYVSDAIFTIRQGIFNEAENYDASN